MRKSIRNNGKIGSLPIKLKVIISYVEDVGKLNWHIQDSLAEIHQARVIYTLYAGAAEVTRQNKIQLCVCQKNIMMGSRFHEEKTI